MECTGRIICAGLVVFCLLAAVCAAADEPTADNVTNAKTAETLKPAEIEPLNLPEDTSPRFTVSQLRISGNTLITTEELLKRMPLVYNTSDEPLDQAQPGDLYDLRILHDVIQQPGQPRQVSRRTMQGFTQYILSVYQDHDYAGIYVYIAAQAIEGGAELRDGLLPIQVVEARVSEITTTAYDIERQKVEKGILKSSLVENWSPVKPGQVVNRKELNEFVNLLNLNPDRYVSAVISRGAEPNSLALEYEIYETTPWHFYIQVDNSGTEQRQWAPKVGLVNTNLTGRDDKLSALYQAPWESGIEDEYLLFGTYGFPVFTPRLRLNLYAGRSEFDTSEAIGADFLGRGSFYGGILSYNIMQIDNWFVDITGSLSHEESKVSASLFPSALGSDIDMDLWSAGFIVHRSEDDTTTSFVFNQTESMGASSSRSFEQARPNTSTDFRIYSFLASHSQYLDPNNIHRLGASFRLIEPSGRLVPAKMTTFGGLYSVRGYQEDEIVADGGILLSGQYEFDLVKYAESAQNLPTESQETRDETFQLRRLAPLVFVDYARAKIKDPIPGEEEVQELCSAGVGIAMDVGDNFSGAVYYGHPLRSTDETDKGEGRFNLSFAWRF
ncbi:MAG: ShlB/FhaC/HecB family protein [Planctomycetota bacterium]